MKTWMLETCRKHYS